MKDENFIVEKGGRKFVDVVRILPEDLDRGRKIIKTGLENGKVEIYVKKRPGRAGHDSKKFVVNRFIELDELFFEGLGLWQGEGGKDKGLYFGNQCLEVLLHFLKFVEEKLELKRDEFKVTINSPNLDDSKDAVKKRWSEKLKIPFENFTSVCRDQRINEEYAQVYTNGIILTETMKNLHEKLKPIILQNKEFTAAYMRGIIAGEAQVAFKAWGTIAYVAISSINDNMITFYKECLQFLGINSGTYQESCRKFPIYGRKNLEKLKLLGLMRLHPIQNAKFERGLSRYRRYIMKGEEMEKLILRQLNLNPKTYNEIASALNKGRSTIQSHYIPILEKKGLIKRIGKRKQAWLFGITENGIRILLSIQ